MVCNSSFQGVLTSYIYSIYDNARKCFSSWCIMIHLYYTFDMHYLAAVTIVLFCPVLGKYNPQIKFEHVCVYVTSTVKMHTLNLPPCHWFCLHSVFSSSLTRGIGVGPDQLQGWGSEGIHGGQGPAMKPRMPGLCPWCSCL